jgi:hypothetical protein
VAKWSVQHPVLALASLSLPKRFSVAASSITLHPPPHHPIHLHSKTNTFTMVAIARSFGAARVASRSLTTAGTSCA